MEKFNAVKILMAAAFLVGFSVSIASILDEPQRQLSYEVEQRDRKNFVTPTELAGWIVEGRRDFVVLDMRPFEKYKKDHIKTAVSCPACHTSEAVKAGFQHSYRDQINFSKKIVLYDQSGGKSITVPKLFKDSTRLYGLHGGFDGWQKEVMQEVTFKPEDDQETIYLKKKKDAIRNFFLGKTITARKLDFKPVMPVGGHKSPKANEGC